MAGRPTYITLKCEKNDITVLHYIFGSVYHGKNKKYPCALRGTGKYLKQDGVPAFCSVYNTKLLDVIWHGQSMFIFYFIIFILILFLHAMLSPSRTTRPQRCVHTLEYTCIHILKTFCFLCIFLSLDDRSRSVFSTQRLRLL